MPIRGIINIPGDKSISHRSLLISSLISGENYISNLSTSLDVNNTLPLDTLKSLLFAV